MRENRHTSIGHLFLCYISTMSREASHANSLFFFPYFGLGFFEMLVHGRQSKKLIPDTLMSLKKDK